MLAQGPSQATALLLLQGSLRARVGSEFRREVPASGQPVGAVLLHGLGPPHPSRAGPAHTFRASLSQGTVSAVEAFEEVMDSLCVPQYNKDGEERVILFLKMAPGHTFGPELVNRLRDAIRRGLSARHVPSLILETQGIPVRPTSCPTRRLGLPARPRH